MNDKNIQLRQAYFELLNGKVKAIGGSNIDIYYLFVPATYKPLYILIQSINSVGAEGKSCQIRDTTIQVVISTRLPKNTGWECDKIADQVLKLIYPNREDKVDGTLGTDLVSDNTITDYDSASKMQIVERIITFRHIN